MSILTGMLLLMQADVITSGTMIIEAVGFESDEGQAVVVLWKIDDWSLPPSPERAFLRAEEPVEGLSATIQLDDVPLGDYVVTVFHDINLDGEFNRGDELSGISGTLPEMSQMSDPSPTEDLAFNHETTVSVVRITVKEMPERSDRRPFGFLRI